MQATVRSSQLPADDLTGDRFLSDDRIANRPLQLHELSPETLAAVPSTKMLDRFLIPSRAYPITERLFDLGNSVNTSVRQKTDL